MDAWAQFLAEVAWFLKPGQTATVGEQQPWSRGSIRALPELSALLESATLTAVSVDGNAYELLAWGSKEHRRGWLCHPPRDGAGERVHETHREFWTCCGGIAERFGEPATWWINQNEVLTATATQVRLAEVLIDYAWLWEHAGLNVPINPDDYYVVAVEANGNLTLAHRKSGRVLLFAPDHAFSGVTPLPGCPPYSLLTIDEAPDLATWIEVCARAWRDR
jgi:hypothetical protein